MESYWSGACIKKLSNERAKRYTVLLRVHEEAKVAVRQYPAQRDVRSRPQLRGIYSCATTASSASFSSALPLSSAFLSLLFLALLLVLLPIGSSCSYNLTPLLGNPRLALLPPCARLRHEPQRGSQGSNAERECTTHVPNLLVLPRQRVHDV